MSAYAPCKDCPDRHYKCHVTCDDYLAYAEQVEKERKERQDYIYRDNLLNKVGRKNKR